jgi:hypothetical protein
MNHERNNPSTAANQAATNSGHEDSKSMSPSGIDQTNK